jgi:hypothetical protein
MAETSGAERLTASLAASSGAGSRAEPVCISSANYTGATPRQRRQTSGPACGGAASGGAERRRRALSRPQARPAPPSTSVEEATSLPSPSPVGRAYPSIGL